MTCSASSRRRCSCSCRQRLTIQPIFQRRKAIFFPTEASTLAPIPFYTNKQSHTTADIAGNISADTATYGKPNRSSDTSSYTVANKQSHTTADIAANISADTKTYRKPNRSPNTVTDKQSYAIADITANISADITTYG
jgi:hypothetical protein